VIELSKIQGAKLNEPEPVNDAELDFLIYVKLCHQMSFVDIQKLFVDIGTLIIKNGSHG